MLPTLPNYISRCFDGLHNAVWYHLDYIRVFQMYCPIVCYVLSYHLLIKIIFGVRFTIYSMKKIILCIFYNTFRIHCKIAYR